MNEQPLDLRASVKALWWRRRLVAVWAAIGLVGGLAYGIVVPPMPSAVALVLLPPTSLSSSGAPTRDATTEIVIASSTPVLAAAGKSVSPPITATKLKHQVDVSALSQDVLQIRVRASKPTDAVRLANAVANDYIQFVATSSSTSTKSALAGLEHESSQLTQQIQGLQTQINTVSGRITAEGPNSSTGQEDSSLLGSLQNEQQQVSLQLDNVNNQVVTDQLSGAAAAQSTRILQNATNATTTSNLVIGAVLGLVLGLLVSIPLVLVRSRRNRPLWRRDEIAAAIEVPVLGSADALTLRTAADWIAFFENYEPSGVDEWNLRRVLHRFAPGNIGTGSNIRVLSFVGDRPATMAGPAIAMFAEELGIPTTLVPCDHEALAPMRAASAARPGAAHREPLVARRPRGIGWDQSSGPLLVSMEPVDDRHPELDPWPGAVLLAVSSGFASAGVLARLALAAVDAGHAIDGILVINPDPSDDTTGVLPQAGAIAPTSTREAVPEQRFSGGFGPSVTTAIEPNGNGATATARQQRQLEWPSHWHWGRQQPRGGPG